MLKSRIIPVGLAVATLLIGGVGAASAGAASAGGPIVQPTKVISTSTDNVKRANAPGKPGADDDPIIKQCIQQVAPDFASLPTDKTQLTPELEAKLRTEKQALGKCVEQATLAAMTPEQRAQKEAEDAKLQKCIQRVAPDLEKASQDSGKPSADEMKQRLSQKINIGVCMGKLTPEQATQEVTKAVAQQERVQQCEQQVAPELATADKGSLTEAQQIDLKQRIIACLNAEK